MKKIIVSWLLSVLVIFAADAQYGTTRTGYEGDYFSLEGALELFKQSHTLVDFERKLNTEENWVNNLDLNYDGRIDYIRVEHRRQGSYHAVILQALVDRYDVQDVAVIEIEVIGAREAILQIVGDEDLYGEEVVVEPVEGYADSRRGYHRDYGDYVNVYYWQPVQYILGRQYRVYVSPYRWQYYPTWWSPWGQCAWSVFRPRVVIYHRYYHVAPRHRVIHVHNFYRTYRSYSYTVVQRTNEVRIKHGKSPIHRAAPVGRQDGNSRDYRGGGNMVERPGATTRSSTQEQRLPVSRKGTLSPADQSTTTRSATPARSPSAVSRTAPAAQPKTNRSTPASANPQSRGTTTRSATPSRSPSAVSRTAPSAQPKSSRSTPASAAPSSRNYTTHPGATTRSNTNTRSATPSRSPSAGSRTAPSAQPKSSRSTPSSVNPQSRGTTTRSATPARSPSAVSRTAPAAQPKTSRSTPASANPQSRGTTTRSATPARSPSASSRGSAPASTPKATRGATSKGSSSKSRGGG